MFESVIEFANALAEGRRFKTPSGCTMFFDEKSNSPFRIGNVSLNDSWGMDDGWGLYDVVTEIKKVVDWTKVPRGTWVEVRDYNSDQFIIRKFADYLPCAIQYKFITYFIPNDKNCASGIDKWSECRLPEGCEVQEDWYKYD